MKDFQIINKANQIKRVKTALMFPSGQIGTFYSNPFRIKYEIIGERFIEIINRQKELSSFDKLLRFIQGVPIPRVP
jgi:hypothetical protein